MSMFRRLTGKDSHLNVPGLRNKGAGDKVTYDPILAVTDDGKYQVGGEAGGAVLPPLSQGTFKIGELVYVKWANGQPIGIHKHVWRKGGKVTFPSAKQGVRGIIEELTINVSQEELDSTLVPIGSFFVPDQIKLRALADIWFRDQHHIVKLGVRKLLDENGYKLSHNMVALRTFLPNVLTALPQNIITLVRWGDRDDTFFVETQSTYTVNPPEFVGSLTTAIDKTWHIFKLNRKQGVAYSSTDKPRLAFIEGKKYFKTVNEPNRFREWVSGTNRTELLGEEWFTEMEADSLTTQLIQTHDSTQSIYGTDLYRFPVIKFKQPQFVKKPLFQLQDAAFSATGENFSTTPFGISFFKSVTFTAEALSEDLEIICTASYTTNKQSGTLTQNQWLQTSASETFTVTLPRQNNTLAYFVFRSALSTGDESGYSMPIPLAMYPPAFQGDQVLGWGFTQAPFLPPPTPGQITGRIINFIPSPFQGTTEIPPGVFPGGVAYDSSVVEFVTYEFTVIRPSGATVIGINFYASVGVPISIAGAGVPGAILPSGTQLLESRSININDLNVGYQHLVFTSTQVFGGTESQQYVLMNANTGQIYIDAEAGDTSVHVTGKPTHSLTSPDYVVIPQNFIAKIPFRTYVWIYGTNRFYRVNPQFLEVDSFFVSTDSITGLPYVRVNIEDPATLNLDDSVFPFGERIYLTDKARWENDAKYRIDLGELGHVRGVDSINFTSNPGLTFYTKSPLTEQSIGLAGFFGYGGDVYLDGLFDGDFQGNQYQITGWFIGTDPATGRRIPSSNSPLTGTRTLGFPQLEQVTPLSGSGFTYQFNTASGPEMITFPETITPGIADWKYDTYFTLKGSWHSLSTFVRAPYVYLTMVHWGKNASTARIITTYHRELISPHITELWAAYDTTWALFGNSREYNPRRMFTCKIINANQSVISTIFEEDRNAGGAGGPDSPWLITKKHMIIGAYKDIYIDLTVSASLYLVDFETGAKTLLLSDPGAPTMLDNRRQWITTGPFDYTNSNFLAQKLNAGIHVVDDFLFIDANEERGYFVFGWDVGTGKPTDGRQTSFFINPAHSTIEQDLALKQFHLKSRNINNKKIPLSFFSPQPGVFTLFSASRHVVNDPSILNKLKRYRA